MTQNSNVLFREIHKNAWLKKLPSVEKRNGAFPKKGERVWIVFCVHDDSEALLELYVDQKLAVAHKPDWFVSLNNCLHVSPTICAQEDEYEFVITLSSEVIRLTAPSWELMMEWVETIRSKLQEMRILSPRENLYSKMPEARMPLAPTRDPNSPLPPTPQGPSARVPGIEPVRMENPDVTPLTDSTDSANNVSVNSTVQSIASPNSTNFETHTSTAFYITQSEPPMYTRPRHVLNRAASVPDSPSAYSSSLIRSPGPRNTSVSNVTVIEVSSYQPVPHSALPFESSDVFNFNVLDEAVRSMENELLDVSIQQLPTESLSTSEVLVLPGPSRTLDSQVNVTSMITNNDNYGCNSNGSSNSSINSISSNKHEDICANVNNSSLNSGLSSSLQDVSDVLSHYECVFLPAQSPSSNHDGVLNRAHNVPSRFKSNASSSSSLAVSSNTVASTHPTSSSTSLVNQFVHNSQSQSSITTTQTSSSLSASSHVSQPVHSTQYLSTSTAVLPVASSTSSHASQTTHSPQSPSVEAIVAPRTSHRRRSRSTSMSEGSSTNPSTSFVERSRVPSTANGNPRTEGERHLQPAPHPYRHLGAVFGADSMSVGRMTLREQQVMQLRREMLHPGGVRLQLRRKDCTNSIALVDAFGAVWVAGWKQKEHPMLYNALHIGDHLVSTGGVPVQSASDAQKLIRGTSSLYVEFVIRRVPCGRVFAIRRETEGQSLGIVQEGNTAEIRDVIPGSPAARHGLVPRAPTCDGLSLTNWILTEINGRPLNLFFKDGEVRDRLNAVGRDISILVQPADLVKQLKKQLKGIRSYKDYIVQ